MLALIIAALILLTAAPAHAAGLDLSGTWKLDRDLTTADMRWDKTDTLVIRQNGDEVRFEYYDRDGQHFATDKFVTDGEERPRYKTRLERAYSRVRWQNGTLMIDTRSYLDADGYQEYENSETWQLAENGNLLVHTLNDGKVIVFRRQDSDEGRESGRPQPSASQDK